jgi:hypothetical protein
MPIQTLLNLQFDTKHYVLSVKYFLDNCKLSDDLSGPPVGGPLSLSVGVVRVFEVHFNQTW